MWKISPPLTMNFIKNHKPNAPPGRNIFVVCHMSFFCFCNEHYETSWKWQFYVQVMQRVVVLDMYTSIMQFTHDQESSIFTIYCKTWSPFINYVNTWIHNHFEQVIFKARNFLFTKFACHVNFTLSSLYKDYHAKPMFNVQ